jgi:hypothetical protein
MVISNEIILSNADLHMDVKGISYRYERMIWKKETNLVVVVIPVEVGTVKLGQDEEPEPMHGHTEGNVQRISLARSTSEQSNKSAKGIDNDRSTITAPGERTRVVVGVDHCFNRVNIAHGEVPANVRQESG